MSELFEEFQEFRKILCVCPCCGDLVRVSDLRLEVKGPAARTWLDDYEKEGQNLDKKEEQFGKIEERLREIAQKRGRIEAEKVFNNAISPAFKALKLDPFDVKPILNPVDFVVFDGMNKKGVISDIILLSKSFPDKSDGASLNLIRHQIQTVVQKHNYDWQVARIDDKGKISFE